MSVAIDQRLTVRGAPPPDGAARRELTKIVSALLKVPPAELDLPPRLMKLYLQSRWPNRRGLICDWLFGIAAINVLVAAFDPFLVDDPQVWIFFAGRLGISAMFVSSAVTLRTMETCGREGLFVIACCSSLVGALGLGGLLVGPDFMQHALAQAMFAGASGLVLARISSRDTKVLAAVLIGLLCVLMAIAPALSLADRAQSIALYASVVVALTMARNVQNRFLYRVFLEGLAERLRMEDMKDANGRLSAMARTDPLTLLPNRRSFDEMLGELAVDDGGRSAAALFMIDIDYFKRLNDDRGHAAGDECLRAVACAIRDELRDGADFLARYGGEEFVVVLGDLDQHEALAVAERVRGAVAALRLPHRSSPFGVVTVSVGVAFPPPSVPAALIAEADVALYDAKALGRNRVRSARDERSAHVA